MFEQELTGPGGRYDPQLWETVALVESSFASARLVEIRDATSGGDHAENGRMGKITMIEECTCELRREAECRARA